MVIRTEREAVARGDVDEYLSTLAEDAVFLPPSADSKAGDDLRQWLRCFVADVSVEWLAFESTEVLVSGDMAYHSFTYTWRVCPRSGGDAKVATGKGVHLLRCRTDGTWKIAREIWNASPARTQ
jgi:ketosteroid isomerase-like protein